MRSAPAFALGFGVGHLEQTALALLGAATAAALAAWLLSYVDAAVGATRESWRPRTWMVVSVSAAAGALLARVLSSCRSGRIAWQQGHWTLQHGADEPREGRLRPMIDGGSWLLLRFDPLPAGRSCWVCVGRRAAGADWHPLRATLFAPGGAPDGTGKGARP
jgi:hypothetical protein